jgi:L-ribulokinase
MRRGRAAWATSSGGSPRTPSRRAITTRRAPRGSTSTTTSPSWPASRRSASTGSSRWNNGNRSILVDHELSGLIVGLTLGTRAEDIYRALIEATAFGTRKIIETFEASGLPVRDLVVAGGLLKNPVIMQIYADVTRRPLHLIGSDQGPALGSAMHAAVAAGAYPDIYAAVDAMGKLRRDVYAPDEARADAYDALYEHYSSLHDHFGRGGDDVMHALRHIRPREVARG